MRWPPLIHGLALLAVVGVCLARSYPKKKRSPDGDEDSENESNCPEVPKRRVVFYDFEKISKETPGLIQDRSGYGNDGIMSSGGEIIRHNDPDFLCNQTARLWNSDLGMNGNVFQAKPEDAITIAAWVKFDEDTGTRSIFDTIGNMHDRGQYHLEAVGKHLRWFHRNEFQTTVFETVAYDVVPKAKWIHVAGTYDEKKGQAKVFIDGELKNFSSSACDNCSPCGACKMCGLSRDWGFWTGIGNHLKNRPLHGSIDNFMIYNYALNKDEIMSLVKMCLSDAVIDRKKSEAANILGTLKNDLNRASNQLNGVRQLHELITKILNQDKPEIEKSQELRRQMEEAKANLHDALLDAEGAQKKIEPLSKYADRRLFATLGKLLQERKDSDEGDAAKEIGIVGDQIKNAEERAAIQAKAAATALKEANAKDAADALKAANDAKTKQLEEDVKKAEEDKKKEEEAKKKAVEEEKIAKLAEEAKKQEEAPTGENDKIKKMADQLAKAEGQKASPPSTDTKKADGKPPSDKLEEMIKKAAEAPTTEDKKLSEALKAAVEKKVEGSREEDSESDSATDAAKSDEDATESLKNALSQAKLVSEAIRQAAAQNKDEPTLDLADEERGLGLSNEGPTDESGSKKDVTKPKARQLETKVSEVNDPAMAPPTMNGQPIKIESTTSQTSKRDATNAGRQLEMKVSEVNEGAAPTFNGQPIHVESKSTQVNAGKRDGANRQLETKVTETSEGPPPTLNGQPIHIDSKSTQVAGKRDGAPRQLATKVTETSEGPPPTLNGQPIHIDSKSTQAAGKRDGAPRQLATKVTETSEGPPPTLNGQPIHIDSKSTQAAGKRDGGKRDAQSTSYKPTCQESIYEAQLSDGPTKTISYEGNHPKPGCKKLHGSPKKIDATVDSSTKKLDEERKSSKKDEQLSANVKVDMKASDSGIKVSDTPDDRSAPTAVQAIGRQNVPCNLSPCNMPALHLSVVNDRKPCDPVVTSNVDIKCMGDGRTPVVKEEYARKKSDVNHLVVVHDENADRRQSIVKPSSADAEEVL